MFTFIYEAAVIIIAGFILLRLAGKKAIAEMTPLEMVTVLSIGTIIGHAIAERKLWQTITCIGLFVLILIVFQYIALRSRYFERLFIGKPTLVIQDGEIITHNLVKLRMTMEQLEMRLRQKGISNITDIRTATIEVNGRLGYELKDSAAPLTQGQAEQILRLLQLRMPASEQQPHDVFEQIRKRQ
ncbi:membrane protein [Paenibacillus darwinianus]|uniref:Membrane protein n=1 Tax=Paenibacillus darwinianus TaxID=1380763 RepID=A0A9W5RZA9_9BACL|nr:YetF domain-containing protein [Paenibacillus darwinianus]EXX84957.1 membrane protein [Paenibacillus darwinianus]EXX84996.1 membrane protein [Paenibacillus darwinianus]